MTQRQKRVLVVLAVVDLLLVVGLGAFALTHRGSASGDSAASATLVTEPSPCATFLLESATRAGWTARVSESDTSLVYEVTIAAQQGATAGDVDVVWSVLEAHSPEYAEVCGVRDTVTLSVLVPGDSGSHRAVTVELQGAVLARWLQGTASDAELAAQARYRLAEAILP